MKDILIAILEKFIDDLKTDNTNINQEQQCDIIRLLSNVNSGQDNEMTKLDAADYLGISVSTFKNHVRDGFLPKGRKVGNFKESRWYKSDFDVYLVNYPHNKSRES